MSNQTLAEKIDILYEARLRNPDRPQFEVLRKNRVGKWVAYLAFDLQDALFDEDVIRLKPRTIIREITHPEPLREAPEPGAELYRAAPDISSRYALILWRGLDHQAQWMRDGLVHSTQEAAIAHGKALAGVSDG
jgi:hypothetical protein